MSQFASPPGPLPVEGQMNDAKSRDRCRELDVQLTFTEAEPVPPDQLRDALRVLVVWLRRISRKPDARQERFREN